MFDVLRVRNFRRFVIGQAVSLTGTWMQRVAQDWLVLELSGNDPIALGTATALQFLPIIFLSLWAGVLADRLNVRKTLMVLQALMGLCALTLGLLDLGGVIQLWQVYLLCLALGCLSALDAPIFESFVVEMVGVANVPKAVPLNSMTFNVSRIVGPALAGAAIGWWGTGWVFLCNAASFAAVVGGLLWTDPRTLHSTPPAQRTPGLLLDGLRYVRGRTDLMLFLTLTLVVGTFASFPTSIPLFTTRVIGSGVGVYGLLSTMLAVGMLIGATLATLYADKVGNRQRLLLLSSSALGALEVVLGLMPSVWLFGLMLVGAGIATTVFVTTAHSTIQLSAEPEVRGRVMGLYMLVLLGGTPIGSPLTGWLADTFGGRAPFAVGGVVTLLTALVCGVLLSFGPRGPQVKTPAPGTTRV